MIDLSKQYRTISGKRVALYAIEQINRIDLGSGQPVTFVIGTIKNSQGQVEMITSWGLEGNWTGAGCSSYNLVEANAYADFEVDAKVIVWSTSQSTRYRRYFAGISPEGKPMTWGSGTTSFSSDPDDKITWEYCELYVEE